MLAAAAMAFLVSGANQQALDKIAPADRHSPRFRRKIVQTARSGLSYHTPVQIEINKLTNWQRNQWRKAGMSQDIAKIQAFAAMPHWKQPRIAVDLAQPGADKTIFRQA